MKGFIKISVFHAKLLLLPVILLVLGTSCKKNGVPDEYEQMGDFIKKEKLGFFGYGGYLFKYSEEECQIAINSRRRQIRMQNDNQLDYVNVKFAKVPNSTDAEISVELRYKVGSDEIQAAVQMEIVKMGDGKIWLWNREKKGGLILPVWW